MAWRGFGGGRWNETGRGHKHVYHGAGKGHLQKLRQNGFAAHLRGVRQDSYGRFCVPYEFDGHRPLLHNRVREGECVNGVPDDDDIEEGDVDERDNEADD